MNPHLIPFGFTIGELWLLMDGSGSATDRLAHAVWHANTILKQVKA